jgi:hypothetical protein
VIRHENNDPRKSEREAAERVRQNRTTKRLVLTIGALLGLIVAILVRRFGLM